MVNHFDQKGKEDGNRKSPQTTRKPGHLCFHSARALFGNRSFLTTDYTARPNRNQIESTTDAHG